MKKRNLLLVLAVGLSGCSYVKVTPEGQGIRLVQALDEVSQCKKLGATTTRVLSKFIFERGKEKVADELVSLARNEAADMGGDTIVPISEVVEGNRKFGIYKCVNP